MKIILFSRKGIALRAEDIEKIFSAIENYGFDYAINREFAESVALLTSRTIAAEHIYDESVGSQPDDAVMVCYGGDGTLLEGVHRLDGADIPVLYICCSVFISFLVFNTCKAFWKMADSVWEQLFVWI